DAGALIMLSKFPRFCSRVNLPNAEFPRVVTHTPLASQVVVPSPFWMARVSVKLNDAPGAMLALVAVGSPVKAWIASASRSPSRLSFSVFGSPAPWLVESRTKLGLSDELLFVIVYVYVMGVPNDVAVLGLA